MSSLDSTTTLLHADALSQERSDGSSALSTFADRLHLGTLLLVLAMSPFEAGYPPFARFSWVTVTNLELVLLALAAVWVLKLAVDPAARARLVKIPLLLPILALLAASLISWAFGEYRGEGASFTYRLVMGAIVCFSAWEALRTGRRMLAAVGTLLSVAAISAALGLLEYAPWIDVQPWLAPFKPMPTTVGGALRLSGTFEYANGAALFFELALPLALGLAVAVQSKRAEGLNWAKPKNRQKAEDNINRLSSIVHSPLSAFGLYVLCGIFAVALLLTLSRAALGGELVALVAFGVLSVLRLRQSAPVALRALGVALLFMAAGGIYVYLTQPIFQLRFVSENDRNWYNVTYHAGDLPSLSASEWVTVPVTVRNDGPMIWRAQGAVSVHLSYHWLSEDKKQIVYFEGARTVLPHDVAPGESVALDGVLQAPPRPGAYYVQWDMVQENVIWFSWKSGVGSTPVRAEVAQVLASAQSTAPLAAKMPPPVRADAYVNSDAVDRGKLWKAAFAMFRAHPLTGVGPDGFRNLYGPYAGVTTWNKNIYTNNTYIEMFANLGLLGGLAFLWLAVAALWLAVRNVLRAPIGARWAIGLGVTASLFAFFAHGFADYFLFSTPMYVMFWFLIGLGVSKYRQTSLITDP